jgi:Zn-finger nucleic acid-binding protein
LPDRIDVRPPQEERLELAYPCPRCKSDAFLVEQGNRLDESRCQRCYGSLVTRQGFLIVAIEYRGLPKEKFNELSQGAGIATKITCPSCSGPMRRVPFDPQVLTAYCTQCRFLWLDPGALYNLTGGAFGRPSRKDEEARRRALARFRGSRPWIPATGLALVLAGIGAFHVWQRHQDLERARQILVVHGVGGEPIAWWEKQLRTLKTERNEQATKLYALTKRRAEANGLIVDDNSERITVTPSEALLEQIVQRMADK